MTPLESILAQYRTAAQSQKEKGSYFEELIRTYFRYEASYADLYDQVWLFADWPRKSAHRSSASVQRHRH